MKQWPEKDQPADFGDLVKEILEAMRFAYTFERKNEGVDIPLIGPEVPPTLFQPSGSESLQIKWLGASPEDQIRTPLEIIIGLALRLGAEQERRSGKQKRMEYAQSANNSIETIAKLIQTVKEGEVPIEKNTIGHYEAFIGFLKRDIEKLAK